jgi:hypothetical protein
MQAKNLQLQIRVTPREKSAIRRLASAARQDLSTYVLSRVLSGEPQRFGSIVRALRNEKEHPFAFAELNDFLAKETPTSFLDAVATADLRGLSAWASNYLAAMVEHTASRLGVSAPGWCTQVEPSETPYFATTLKSLRPYLLCAAPTAFKRRNIFVDSSVGSRV